MNPKDPFHAMRVIIEGIAGSFTPREKRKEPKVVYCNLDKTPYLFCGSCADREICGTYHDRVNRKDREQYEIQE